MTARQLHNDVHVLADRGYSTISFLEFLLGTSSSTFTTVLCAGTVKALGIIVEDPSTPGANDRPPSSRTWQVLMPILEDESQSLLENNERSRLVRELAMQYGLVARSLEPKWLYPRVMAFAKECVSSSALYASVCVAAETAKNRMRGPALTPDALGKEVLKAVPKSSDLGAVLRFMGLPATGNAAVRAARVAAHFIPAAVKDETVVPTSSFYPPFVTLFEVRKLEPWFHQHLTLLFFWRADDRRHAGQYSQ